jgi:hypothetical protein
MAVCQVKHITFFRVYLSDDDDDGWFLIHKRSENRENGQMEEITQNQLTIE